jgi:hypothetical protein
MVTANDQRDDETCEDYGQRLVAEGYQSTSNKYMHVARVPPGKTAIQVLSEIAPNEARILYERLEHWAVTRLLRVFPHELVKVYPAGQLELTETQYRAFRKAGGQTV